MHLIRHFEAHDLPDVVALMRAHLPPPIHDETFLVSSLLEPPSADPELPSLVAVDESDAVVGFLAGPARQLTFDGRQLRGVCCSHLVVSESARASATGVQLLRRLLSGPQDLTFTDSANDAVLQVWRALGGHLDHSRSLDWMLVLRPGRLIRSTFGAMVRRRSLRELLPIDALPAQAAGRLVHARAFPSLQSGIEGSAANVDEILEVIPSTTARIRLRGDHEAGYLERAFEYLRQHHELVTRIVREGGTPIGWYAYLVRESGAARAIHVSATPRQIDSVVGEMLADAQSRGSVVMSGRFEPILEKPLRRRAVAAGFARRALFQARDPEVAAVLGSGSSLLTQLDGEWHLV